MLKRSIGAVAVAAAFIATGSVATNSFASNAETKAASLNGRSIQCNGTLNLGNSPKTKVVVASGASCTIVHSTIKSLRTKPGAVDVRVSDTEVTRNLMVRGATGTVHIGPAGCGYDPMVGNNVVVRNSHNVLICFTKVDNNIMVRNNDGRITVRDSSAGNNIRVNRNLAFVADPGPAPHARMSAIRILRNEADNHIVARGNAASREVIARDNTPAATIA
jgi:hypothetical protein